MNSTSLTHPALRVFLVDEASPVRRRMAALFGALDSVQIVGEAEEPGAALIPARDANAPRIRIPIQRQPALRQFQKKQCFGSRPGAHEG